ncbi:MAG TPA: peptidylprolyl isomerase [Chitinophagaceae bacterium]|nr:peptidylprolyl isomerase [Chitinophagaceae bacterium]
MRKPILFFLLLTLCSSAFSQTLFTYGKYAVDAKDFLRAYKKNNTGPVANKTRSINDYLDLYIKSRLKIQEAYERRYDTLPMMRTELANLRTQITENYLTDPDLTARMTKEAFQRSQKDIRVGHIFISFRGTENFIDTVAAQKRVNELFQRLQKGEDFAKLARELSDDTAARSNGGDIGYITVFTIPYEFETVIYNTAVGKYSSVVRSKIGYHIFKNLGERKATGKIKAQQILLAIPTGSTEPEKKQIAARADSIYKRILAGDNFNRLAADLSNDYVTAIAGGVMPDIGVGQYDPAFEKVLWSLPKDGSVSKPFLTSHGWHILKRIGIKPVISDPRNKTYQQELEQKISSDSRGRNSRDFIYNKVKSKKGFKKFPYEDAALWNMSDSVLDQKPMTTGWAIKSSTPLFSIGDSVYDANDWVNYAHTYRYKQDGTGAKSWEQVREEWINYTLLEYFKEHLEEFSPEFTNQMVEFKEGNLFFEIMQQEVWNRAQTDSAALLALYEKNKKNYLWKHSADAVLFFCADMNTANALYDKVKSDPKNWRIASDLFPEKMIADSSRYEWEQIPNLNRRVPTPGMITSPQLNVTDNTASFAYVINIYTQPSQRSFAEARGQVINDYQVILEEKWNEALKKKYPVFIDQKVLAEISR